MLVLIYRSDDMTNEDVIGLLLPVTSAFILRIYSIRRLQAADVSPEMRVDS